MQFNVEQLVSPAYCVMISSWRMSGRRGRSRLLRLSAVSDGQLAMMSSYGLSQQYYPYYKPANFSVTHLLELEDLRPEFKDRAEYRAEYRQERPEDYRDLRDYRENNAMYANTDLHKLSHNGGMLLPTDNSPPPTPKHNNNNNTNNNNSPGSCALKSISPDDRKSGKSFFDSRGMSTSEVLST